MQRAAGFIIAIGVAAATAYLAPQIIEDAPTPCAAYAHAKLREMGGDTLSGALTDGVANTVGEGVAAASATKRYPRLPQRAACALAYWSTRSQ